VPVRDGRREEWTRFVSEMLEEMSK
jgi:hypothetical protein